FPLPKAALFDDKLDERRVRALAVSVMEQAAGVGHSVLPFDDLLDRLRGKSLDESFPIDEDILGAQAESDFFSQEIHSLLASKDNPTHFFKLRRLVELKSIIRQRINLTQITSKPYNVEKDWLSLINSHRKFPELDRTVSSHAILTRFRAV